MSEQPGPTVWDRIRRNPHRIAVALFAVMLAVVVVNAVSVDNQATTFPTAEEADGAVPSPRPTPDTSNTPGLIAGFGLFGLWAVLGIVAFLRPKRTPKRTEPAASTPPSSSREQQPEPKGDPSLN